MPPARYIVPIPESIGMLESRRELNEMAEQYPMSTVGVRNGGWYMYDHDGTVLAVASNSVCAELDASLEEAMWLYGLLPDLDSEVSEPALTHVVLRRPHVCRTVVVTCANGN
ncbi:hypothetical protein N7516_000726 [Penicillium verrucosum]|uniref:uncharacterized protein n=1 Tax=Penicillium verrucosum TaxID=60171 RepID=UPI002545A2FB|nr:uncharacterized protein N7516_000726 [Penicillium verrucosum]KAJ5940558.1 hypothetical protein N7516_000726 [Penicillium verrucosum]